MVRRVHRRPVDDITARVFAGQLTLEGYDARIAADENAARVGSARTFAMSRPELTAEDLRQIRMDLPGIIASLR